MRRFHFSMQKLLDARDAEEKGCQLRLASKRKAIELTRREQDKLILTRNQKVAEIIKSGRISAKGWSVVLRVSYLHSLDTRIHVNEGIIHRMEQEESRLREELTAAMREKKMLERLCEKELTQWRLSGKILEQKEIDEVASTGFFRHVRAV